MKIKSRFCAGIIFAIFIFHFWGCSGIMRSIYGIKEPREVTRDLIAIKAVESGIPPGDNYLLDTAYVDYLKKRDTFPIHEQVKNHLQPLQALYFDGNGNFRAFYINCYASGFPNLKWNRHGSLTTFPPHTQAPVDSIIMLTDLLDFAGIPVRRRHELLEHYEFIVVVFWNHFMGRQSKIFIREIQKNCKLAKVSVTLIYLNNDDLFVKMAR